MLRLNTVSLEDWTPNQPPERWCAVAIRRRYEFDGQPRVEVEILDGPEAGRVVSGLSPGNLRTVSFGPVLPCSQKSLG